MSFEREQKPETVWLSVSKISDGVKCRRRLAHELNPDRTPARSANAPFRLYRAITDAISEAHLIVQELSQALPAAELLITALLERRPPVELGHEELARFNAAVAAYADSFSDSEARYVEAPTGPYRRPSARRTWGVSGAIDLRFRRPDGTTEIRKIVLGGTAPHPSTPVPLPDILRFSLIGENGFLVHLHVPTDESSPGAIICERTVSEEMITESRSLVREAIDAAVDLVDGSGSDEGAPIDDPRNASPGWWCNQCTYVRGCPAVPQQTTSAIIESYQG